MTEKLKTAARVCACAVAEAGMSAPATAVTLTAAATPQTTRAVGPTV